MTKTQQLKLSLEQHLSAHAMGPHQLFLSYSEICARYQTDPMTVRMAIADLEREGVLYTKNRRGIFVSPPARTHQLLLVARTVTSSDAISIHEESMTFHQGLIHQLNAGGQYAVHLMDPDDFVKSVEDIQYTYKNLKGIVFFLDPAPLLACRNILDEKHLPCLFYGSSTWEAKTAGTFRYLYRETGIIDAAMGHLASKGHTRIATVSTRHTEVLKERASLALRWLADNGHPCDPSSTITLPDYHPDEDITDIFVKALSMLPREITAVFSPSDRLSAYLIKAVHRRGGSVPKDLSLVSVNNSLVCRYLEPALSTVMIPFFEDGVEVGRLFTGKLSEPEGRKIQEPECYFSNTRLVPRQSVKPL